MTPDRRAPPGFALQPRLPVAQFAAMAGATSAAAVVRAVAGAAVLVVAGAVFAVAAVAPVAAAAAALPGGPPASTASGADAYVSYTGTAMAPHSDKFLYGESDVLVYHGDSISQRVVLYTCRDGAAFARKTVSYVDDLAPDFSLEDASNGMREGVHTEGGTREAFFRSARDAKERTAPLPRVPGLVADAGFDEFVRANWQALMSGRTLTMPFWVPSRMEDVEFHVEHVRSDRTDGVPVEVFRLKLANLLGSILSGIDVYYSAADHVLHRYVGISDLRDASNDNFKTVISFSPGDRRRSAVHELDGALHARLAPCK